MYHFLVGPMCVNCLCLGTFLYSAIREWLSTSPMDPSELVYVVAAEDDLPISLQLVHADGALQPRILTKSSAHSGSRDIAVYNEQGHDISEDLVIEMFEYIVDENGKVSPLDSKPSNRSISVDAAGCTKSSMSEDTDEPNMTTILKAQASSMMTFSRGNSHMMNLDNMQPNSPEYNKVDVSVTPSECVCSHAITINSDGDHSVDSSAFPASAVEMTAVETNQNAVVDTPSVLCEANPFSVCSPSCNNLESENHSVPSSPAKSCHGIQNSVGEVAVDFAADDSYSTACRCSACLTTADCNNCTMKEFRQRKSDIALPNNAVSANNVADADSYFLGALLDAVSTAPSKGCQSELDCLSARADCGNSTMEEFVQQKHDHASPNNVMSANDVDGTGSSRLGAALPTDVTTAMHSESYRSELDCLSSTDASPNNVMNANDVCDTGCNHLGAAIPLDATTTTAPSKGYHSQLDHLSPTADCDHNAVEQLVQQTSDSVSPNSVMNANNVPRAVSDNLGAALDAASTAPSKGYRSELECAAPSPDCNNSTVEDFWQQKGGIVSPNNVLSANDVDDGVSDNLGAVLDAASSAPSKGYHSESEFLAPTTDNDNSAVEEFMQQKQDDASPNNVLSANVDDGVSDNLGAALDAASSASSKCYQSGLNCSLPCDKSTAKQSVQQNGDIMSANNVITANGMDDIGSYSLCTSSDATSTAASRSCRVSEPINVSASSVINREQEEITDNIANSECQLQPECTTNGAYNGCQEIAESEANSECQLQPECTANCTYNGCQEITDSFTNYKCQIQPECTTNCTYNGCQEINDSVTNSKCQLQMECTTNGADNGCQEITDNIANSECQLQPEYTTNGMYNGCQEITDSIANSECQLQTECTTNQTYNGCQRDLLKVLCSFSSNVHDMRQRLRVLHRSKTQPGKLPRNESPICAGGTDEPQTNTDLDTVCDTKCKKLRLEAIDQELTRRDLLLRHREELVRLRSQRLVLRERALCEREQLLAQYCLSLARQESPNIRQDSQLHSVPDRQTIIDHESDAVGADSTNVSKRRSRRCRPYRVPKQKVQYMCGKNLNYMI